MKVINMKKNTLCGKLPFGSMALWAYFRGGVHTSGNGGVVRNSVSTNRSGETL